MLFLTLHKKFPQLTWIIFKDKYIHTIIEHKKLMVPTMLATLEGWRAIATLGSLSRSVAVSRGCLQGGVLSPLLRCLVVDELLARLSGGGVYAQGYADDICLLAI
jgi:hypothetical protein